MHIFIEQDFSEDEHLGVLGSISNAFTKTLNFHTIIARSFGRIGSEVKFLIVAADKSRVQGGLVHEFENPT